MAVSKDGLQYRCVIPGTRPRIWVSGIRISSGAPLNFIGSLMAAACCDQSGEALNQAIKTARGRSYGGLCF